MSADGGAGGSRTANGAGRGLPRALEAALAAVGLVALSPLLLLAALAVVLGSGRPVLFRQERVGLGGRRFFLYKLRTMKVSASGPQVTARGDARVTPVGRALRRAKLDELPQLWNVVKGDMSLVGPRPEVPLHVEPTDPLWQRVLAGRPGLTDPVTILLRDEEALLAAVPGDRERFYAEALQPWKLRGYAAYLESRTWRSDLAVLARTVLVSVVPSAGRGVSLDEISPRAAAPRV